MSWPMVPLESVLLDSIGGVWGEAQGIEECDVSVWRVTELKAMGRIDASTAALRSVSKKQLARRKLQLGDLLLEKSGGGPKTPVGRVGLVAAVAGDAICSNFMQLMRPSAEEVEPRFLHLYLNHFHEVGGTAPMQVASTNIRNIKASQYLQTLIPLPPIDEQRRVVKTVEHYFVRLDAADRPMTSGLNKLDAMVTSVLLELIPDERDYPSNWKRSTVGEAGRVELGRQRHPDWHTGPNMRPYLRVANVFEDRIDSADVDEMHWPEDTFERYKLIPGDVLLNEGQIPNLLGRPALYRGVPADVAFTKTLIRFQAGPDVLPEFALLVFRRHMRAGRFKRESRITTNIAHLPVVRLKPIEFPVPSLAEQQELVDQAQAKFDAVSRLGDSLRVLAARKAGLRRSVLAAAFAGRLACVDHRSIG